MTLEQQPLHQSIRTSAESYFTKHGIAWWGGAKRPTSSPRSSQVACVNHLEPARVDPRMALALARNLLPDAVDVDVIEGGYLAYEWVGLRNHLGERGWHPSSRGRNITSVDAVMVVRTKAGSLLVLLEWKYTETYKLARSLVRSKHGTDRVRIYRPLLEDPDCPIVLGDHGRLFYDPFYQLMRQTLLAWQMTRSRELGVSDWLHVHIIPDENVKLRTLVTSPGLTGMDMSSAWRSVLTRPDRYIVRTPRELIGGVAPGSPWSEWRQWLHARYGT